MKKITPEHVRIAGVGVVKIAAQPMTIHQAINAKSQMGGLPASHFVEKNGVSGPVHLRCFISLCEVKEEYKQAPNRGTYTHPNCF